MEEEKHESADLSSEARKAKEEGTEAKKEEEKQPAEVSPEDVSSEAQSAEEEQKPEEKEEKEEKAEVVEEKVEGKPEEKAAEEKPFEKEAEEEPVAAEPAQPKEKEEEKATEKVEEKPKEEEKVEEKEAEEKIEEKVEAKAEEKKEEGKWYVIQTLTGQEDRVKQAIEQTIESKGLKEKVFQVLVPTEETVEIKGGKRLERVRKMFPGYVFLQMILDEESWYLIRQTPGVARFIGTKIRPTPVSDREMQRVLKQLGKEERLEITFEKGEGVRVISGPFRGYTGTVDEVNAEKGKLKVLINIFGRDTPVEVNFEHAQKIV